MCGRCVQPDRRKTLCQGLEIETISACIDDQNIPHRPAHAAGYAGHITSGIVISDPVVLADVQAKWSAIRALASKGATGAQIPGAYVIFPQKDPRFSNLPFLLSYAALEQVLEQLAYEGTISAPCGRPTLHNRLVAARDGLTWISYDTVDEGRAQRNALAHDATLLNEHECHRFIEAIERELLAWGVVTNGDAQHNSRTEPPR